MRLITLALELVKVELTFGTAVKSNTGIIVSNPRGKLLDLPLQTLRYVIDDPVTHDAITRIKEGAVIPMSVFHLACKRIVDEYYTPGRKQTVMSTRLVVHDDTGNPIASLSKCQLPLPEVRPHSGITL